MLVTTKEREGNKGWCKEKERERERGKEKEKERDYDSPLFKERKNE